MDSANCHKDLSRHWMQTKPKNYFSFDLPIQNCIKKDLKKGVHQKGCEQFMAMKKQVAEKLWSQLHFATVSFVCGRLSLCLAPCRQPESTPVMHRVSLMKLSSKMLVPESTVVAAETDQASKDPQQAKLANLGSNLNLCNAGELYTDQRRNWKI